MDMQLLIDPHACLEDFTKYAAKPKRCHDVFINFVGHVTDNSSGTSVVRKLFVKPIGERDMVIQDVMHQIPSLKLYNLSFKHQTI